MCATISHFHILYNIYICVCVRVRVTSAGYSPPIRTAIHVTSADYPQIHSAIHVTSADYPPVHAAVHVTSVDYPPIHTAIHVTSVDYPPVHTDIHVTSVVYPSLQQLYSDHCNLCICSGQVDNLQCNLCICSEWVDKLPCNLCICCGQVEKSIHGLLEETDSRQSVIFHQRQVLADQMSEATYTINAATTRLKDVVEDMQQQLLSQLCARIMNADDALSKVQLN